jgi:hypothetical protein
MQGKKLYAFIASSREEFAAAGLIGYRAILQAVNGAKKP